MSKHRGGKGDFAEHPARARDEVKKRGKKSGGNFTNDHNVHVNSGQNPGRK